MKTYIIILSSILILSLFTQCGSAQKFDNETPFNISKAYYQDWVGGKPGSNGIIITIEIPSIISNEIILDSVFFRRKMSKLSIEASDQKQIATANFSKNIFTARDIIMNSDPRKEMANKAPDVTITFPFELTDSECVISYFVKNKKHYYKLTNIKKTKTIYYP